MGSRELYTWRIGFHEGNLRRRQDEQIDVGQYSDFGCVLRRACSVIWWSWTVFLEFITRSTSIWAALNNWDMY